MSRVGVGVITAGKRKIQEYHIQSDRHEVDFHIQLDEKLEGPAKMRNKCLAKFADYDFIFLFDDDTYPIRSGWIDYTIDHHLKSGCHWFGIPDPFRDEVLKVEGEVAYWNNLIGAFSFYSKSLLETIGGYNTAYNRYGYEDAGYQWRVHRSGLIGSEGFPSPLKLMTWIKAEDVLHCVTQQNMSQEEKNWYIEQNRPIFEKEISENQLFYEFR